MRLDLYLVEQGLFKSRHQAQLEIKNNRIKVNGRIIQKPSYPVGEGDDIIILEAFNPYVGKGGLKLAHALDVFNLNVNGMRVLDVGASTGGFTDCLIKHGAACVIAVDVGTGQLDESLKQDPRITSYENTNFLHTDDTLFTHVDLIVMDVSFTSCFPLIEHASQYTKASMVVLFKPQFESMKTPKSGIVKDKRIHRETLNLFLEKLKTIHKTIESITFSPIKGGSGNIEFLCLIGASPNAVNITAVIDAAHKSL